MAKTQMTNSSEQFHFNCVVYFVKDFIYTKRWTNNANHDSLLAMPTHKHKIST